MKFILDNDSGSSIHAVPVARAPKPIIFPINFVVFVVFVGVIVVLVVTINAKMY